MNPTRPEREPRSLRILSEREVQACVGMGEAIEAMREAFGALAAGEARSPLRVGVDSGAGEALFMPACLEGADGLGGKVVTVFGGNPERGLPAVNALVLLLDPDNGLPRALLSGTHLTALRTAAASGLATALLAREDAGILAVFGAGAQAPFQIEAVQHVRPIREVRIVSRTGDTAEALARRVSGSAVRAVRDPREALRGADVVVTATDSRDPVFRADDVDPGTHVNGIGSYTPEMREVDPALVPCARVVVDARSAALEEAGELVTAVESGELDTDPGPAELGEVVNGSRAGRASEEEITFFKSVGLAVQDVALGRRVLAAAGDTNVGTVVGLEAG